MELLVYKASAGSGKTFTLAVEYIKHLIMDPRAYRQILAVTFTNKATAEMKERILQQLYGIWKGDPASKPYLERIRQDLARQPFPLAEEELRRRAGTALQYMLHDYSRFRVETIDSFFQSVMRNLARELELSPSLNIELNNAEVLGNAVDSLIEKLTPDSPVLAWLLEYIDERIADDKRWNVSEEVKSFGRNIFDEGYLERGEALRQKLQDPQVVKLYRATLRCMEQQALQEMQAYHRRFEELLDGHALVPDDLKGGSRGIGSYFRKLRDGKLADKEAANATLQSCLADARNWVAKTSSRRDEIIRLAEDALLPLLREAEQMRPSCARMLNSCRLSLQHLNKLQLLNHIDEEVRTLNREHNRFLLSDTNALLHRLVREGDSSFVFEKIGAQIRNVMIDEFQDTSRMQWDNFRLLLLEGLSQGADSLIVGDVKQSIYRWRNGDWGILNSLGQEAAGASALGFPLNNFPVRVETLKTNRRSEARIIGFNNELFAAAVAWLNALHLEELHEECLPLKQAYADVAQESPREEQRGYVKAAFLQLEEGEDYTALTLQALGEEVTRLQDAGVRLGDITILVRKNKNIPPIANYFDKVLGIPIVSDEAFRLDASPAVRLLVDALRCLACPDNGIARASLAAACAPAPLPEAFTGQVETLRLMPLYELLEELHACFHLGRMERQEAYLFAFFDAVTEYLQNGTSDLDAFLCYWDEQLCAKTIPGGETEGLRILSIHKSKGLEFHTVLLPFCDWKLENETSRQLVWCAPQQEPYNGLDLVPVSYGAAMAESVYRQDYLHERLQLWVDNLNLLYVALTRAEKNLILWTKQGQRGTMSELLAAALPRVAEKGTGNWDAEAGQYEYGIFCTSAPSATASGTCGNRLARRPDRLPVHMESLRPQVEFRQSNRSADFIAGVCEAESRRRFIDRGLLMHTLFSAIRTVADIDPAIDRLVFEGIIGAPEQEQEVRALARRAFAHPQVRDWYSGSWQLYSECDIIWMEQGRLQNRRPDRVMMDAEGHIVVVDFKFGQPRPHYRRQVKGYMDLLARMGYRREQICGYLWYVDEERVEEV